MIFCIIENKNHALGCKINKDFINLSKIKRRIASKLRLAISKKVSILHPKRPQIDFILSSYHLDFLYLSKQALISFRNTLNKTPHGFRDCLFFDEMNMSCYYAFNCSKFYHHLLVVTVALGGRTGTNGIAHYDVYLGTFSLFVT